jgi:hypothetical protein
LLSHRSKQEVLIVIGAHPQSIRLISRLVSVLNVSSPVTGHRAGVTITCHGEPTGRAMMRRVQAIANAPRRSVSCVMSGDLVHKRHRIIGDTSR